MKPILTYHRQTPQTKILYWLTLCPLMTLCLSTAMIHIKSCMIIDIANKISTLLVTLILTDWFWMSTWQSACPYLTYSLSVQPHLWLPQLIMWNMLTHWGRGKMAANFLMIFSNACSWMKIYKFLIWSLILLVTSVLTDWFCMAIWQSVCPHLTHSVSVQSHLEQLHSVMC